MIRSALVVLTTLAVLSVPSGALADGSAPAPAGPTQLMMPGQDQMDQRMSNSGMNGGTWSDMTGGLTARPYIKSLSVINDGQSVPVFSGGVGAAWQVPTGSVTAVLSPTNLCGPGQAPAPGSCYATPNRVGISFGYKTDEGLGLDFANPSVPLAQTVTPDTVFDVVIGLNTLGKTLRWSWVNGNLVDWKTTDLGQDDAEIHLRVKPSETPWIDFNKYGPVGCTATPIRDCEIPRSDQEYLGSQMFLSLDDTLSGGLTGAAFATQGAIDGFLVPSGSPSAPTLDMEMASAHLLSDGSPTHGTLQAFLPATTLLDLYGVLPTDAGSFFSTTRTGDPGTSDAPVFTPVTGSSTDDAGLRITVSNITFSAPTYRVSRREPTLHAHAARHGHRLSVATAALTACRRRACTATVYKLGTALSGQVLKVAGQRTDKHGAAVVDVNGAKLPRGSHYIVAVRRGRRLVATTRGTA
jgi:hypothetical protein